MQLLSTLRLRTVCHKPCFDIGFIPSTQELTSSGVSAMKFITRLAVIRVKELSLKEKELFFVLVEIRCNPILISAAFFFALSSA